MRRTVWYAFIALSQILLIGVFTIQTGLGQSGTRSAYEASYLYLTDPSGHDYPDNGTPSWGDDDFLANGITHDDDNWYICSLETDDFGAPDGDWVIWRIPVLDSLDQDFMGNPAVLTVRKSTIGLLANYGHAGDLDHVKRNGTDYLLVPLTGGSKPVIAFFLAASLTFINYAILSDQDDVGWCAVHADSNLFTSNDDTQEILRYNIDWTRVPDTTAHDALTLINRYPLTDGGGGSMLLRNMQGGEFTPSGELLFVSCGVFGPDRDPTIDGIHVFDTGSWKEIMRSFNSGFIFVCCPPFFIFSFDNSLEGGDEPEGLTIWDLDDGRAPHVRGQLHVLVDIHNGTHTNATKLKHYTKRLYVDGTVLPPPPPNVYDPPPLHGSPEEPFNSVSSAIQWYNPIWDGAEIVLRAGLYGETGVFSRRVRLVSEGGTATIGR